MKNKFMQQAIDKAWKYQLLTYPNPAVGATVVKDGKVLSVEAHKQAGMPHAEVLALKEAYLTFYPNSLLQSIEDSAQIHDFLIKNHNNFFQECEIYVTLEPCNHTGKTPACAQLLEKVRIKKVYIGTLDPNPKASGGLQRLRDVGIEVCTQICQDQTDKLLYPFFKWQTDKFVFFKLAMRKDGSIDGGYITTKDSLTHVHNIRNNLDLLVIGGETVRVDRPTLNCRYASQNNPPDILIYSNQNNFDTTIPLFSIKNREVSITNSLEILKSNKFVMIEGGYNLLNSLKSSIDYLVIYMSNNTNSEDTIDINQFGFEEVYRFDINENDTIIFLEKS